MKTVGELVEDARRRLAGAAFAPAPREASLLAARVMERSEAYILAHPEGPVTAERARAYEDLLLRRLRGEPVAYLFSEKEFYGRPFYVDRRVLIPRPETEHLVEAALRHLGGSSRVLDVGTGSGCIAATLALEQPSIRVVATDRSPAALAVAAINLRRFQLAGRVDLLAADLFEPLHLGGFQVVVANLPYVDPGEADLLSPEIKEFEPPDALFPRERGTAALERLLQRGSDFDPGTRILLEIGAGQSTWLEERVRSTTLDLVAVQRDYARIPRVVELARR